MDWTKSPPAHTVQCPPVSTRFFQTGDQQASPCQAPKVRLCLFCLNHDGSFADSRASGSRCCPSDTAANRSRSLRSGMECSCRCCPSWRSHDPRPPSAVRHPRQTPRGKTSGRSPLVGACWLPSGVRVWRPEGSRLCISSATTQKGLFFPRRCIKGVQCNLNPSSDPTLSPRLATSFVPAARNPNAVEPSVVPDKVSITAPSPLHHLDHQLSSDLSSSWVCLWARKLPTGMSFSV